MQVYDLPVTHNPLRTRSDVELSLRQILDPTADKLIMGGTGLWNYNGSTSYSDRVGLFEGWSRLLWGEAPMRSQGGSWKGQCLHDQGFIHGPNPHAEGFWGPIHDKDQRMVELAAISYALMLDRRDYWDVLSKDEQQRLHDWMLGLNGKEMPGNNWRFFRVLVNLAFKCLGEKYDAKQMADDLAFIDSLYVADGWYRDNVPFDNYNPFAFHFYSLVYVRFAADFDKERCDRFKKRAYFFAKQHIALLGEDGAVVPYGRSLTYKFGPIAFYSACVMADLEVLPWGVLKGIILRNLRWWMGKPIFDRDGMLTNGYCYPNLIFCERYNGQGSPYWGLKVYAILAQDEEHPFWKSEELPLPMQERVRRLDVPHMLVMRTDDDVIALNGGQYPVSSMNHAAEKYAKFAYSIRFGFSVSLAGCEFDKIGIDSMLLVSRGDDYWRQRRQGTSEIHDEYVKSVWKPFEETTVTTYLIPSGNCHIRVHRITSSINLVTREGGFAIERYHGFDEELSLGVRNIPGGIILSMPWAESLVLDSTGNRQASYIVPDPNLNCNFSTTAIPYLEGRIEKGNPVWYVTVAGATTRGNLTFPTVVFHKDSRTIAIDGKRFFLA